MAKPTRFQRQVLELIGRGPRKEDVANAALHFGTSKGKILKALHAAGGGVCVPCKPTAPGPGDDGCHVKPTAFSTTGDTSVKEAWVDAYGGLWLESNDKERVVVPRAQLQRFLSLLR